MKKVESVLLVLVMLVAVPCLAFEGYQVTRGKFLYVRTRGQEN